MKGKQYFVGTLNVLLILAVFVGAIFISRNRPIVYDGASKYTTADVVYADGQTAHFDSKNFGSVSKGDTVTLHVALPKEATIPVGTLAFYDYSTVTEVWYGDVLLDSHGEDSAARGRLIGNHVFFVDIPSGAWGDEITIVLRPTENHAFTDFPQLKIYPSQNTNQWFVDNDSIGFVLTLALFAFSVFGALACVLGGMRGATLKNGLYLVLLALIVSLWLISNRMMYSLFRMDFYFWEPLEYMAGFTIAVPVLLFYRGMAGKGSVWRKIFGWSTGAVLAFFIIATVLNFTNILHYSAFTIFSSLLLAASSLLLLVYSFLTRKEAGKENRMLRTGSYIFVATCLYELLFRSVVQYLSIPVFYNLPTLITLGFVFLLLCMIGAFVSDLYEKQKDLLTAQDKAKNMEKFFSTIPAGVCIFSIEGKLPILQANDMFFNIFGYDTQESAKMAGFDSLSAFPLNPRDRAEVGRQYAKMMQGTQKMYEFELNIIKPDGSSACILSKYCQHSDDRRLITANVIDITDRKQMEEELRLSEERYKLALTQSGKVFFFFDVASRTIRLPRELAVDLGLPLEVKNMPESYLKYGIIATESIDNYSCFCERILAGEETGETVLACHKPKAPEKTLWYRLLFTSIFDAGGKPVSTIITCEDFNVSYQAELSSMWRQMNLMSASEKEYVIAIYDFTRNHLISQTGELFAKLPEFEESYDGTNRYVLANFIHPEDVEELDRFLNLSRLMELYQNGKTEDYIEYRALQSGSDYRWTSLAVQMITDPYTRHVMAQLLFLDIHEQKSGQIEIRQNMEQLQKELDNSRIKIMINQMQPHFLYNALSAIKMITKRDPDRAYNLIQDFTVHLRSSIRALSSDAPIPFTEEMNNVRAYLNIELTRFENRLHVEYDIQCEDFEVIPLTIQPIVENAVKHGVFPKGKAGGTVSIRSYETAASYVVEVADDGAGFDVSKAMEDGNDSYGLKNLVFRLKSLMQADVAFRSDVGTGTLVTVTLPKKTQKGGGLDECHSCG